MCTRGTVFRSSWQSAYEGGQVEAELSDPDTLYQAASVMVVSEHSVHSRQKGNKGMKPFYNTMPCCL